jgi:glucose-1-phosphatase
VRLDNSTVIKAVIFDLGGVLVRTEDRRSRTDLAHRLGITYDQLSSLVFESESARLATLGKRSTEEHWESVRETLEVSADAFPTVRADFWGGDVLDTELVAYISSLKPRIKTGLLSNAWDNLRKVINNTWKISQAFDDIVISAEVGISKPDPRIYHLAVERLGVLPQEAAFVDDFPNNVRSAQEVGLHGILFKSSDQTLQDLEELLNEG